MEIENKKTNFLDAELLAYIREKKLCALDEQTIEAINKAVILPLISNDCSRSVILLRLQNPSSYDNVFKRLEYSNSSVYSFTNDEKMQNFPNPLNRELFENMEFVIALASRYCACVVWSKKAKIAPKRFQCFVSLNSRWVKDILKIICKDSKVNFLEIWDQLSPERRANELLNEGIYNLIRDLNETKYELVVQEKQAMDIFKEKIDLDKIKKSLHEINNYLSVLDLNCKILEKKIQNSNFEQNQESILTSLASISKSKNAIVNIVSSIKNKDNLNLQRNNVEFFVKETLNLMKNIIEKENVKVEFEIDPNLYAFFDFNLTQNVLVNLLYNAIDAIYDNGIIKIYSKHKDISNIEIFVENNGKKINADLLNQIFSKGFTTKTHGCGLGLNVSKENMQKQNGDLLLETNEENKVVFKIVIAKNSL